MTGKAIAYFFLGFVAGLIVVESQKDKPFAPVRFHDGKALETRIYYYRYNPYEYNMIDPLSLINKVKDFASSVTQAIDPDNFEL